MNANLTKVSESKTVHRPGNSSQSFSEPEFISAKFLPIYVIFDIDKILFLFGISAFGYIDPKNDNY